MTIEPTGEYVSIQEAALRLKLAAGTIRRWIRIGWIEAYCPGQAVRVRMSEILAARSRHRPQCNQARDSNMRFKSQKVGALPTSEKPTQPIVEAAPQTTPIDDWYARAAKRDK